MLRTVAGAATALQGVRYPSPGTELATGEWVLGLFAIISGVALIAGFLTPAAATVAGAATLLSVTIWAPATTTFLRVDGLAALLLVVISTALALLGPGARSIDSYLFGRREIIIPHGSPHRDR